MGNFKVHQIIIGNKFLDEIIDEEGIKWYPLNMFFKNILCKSDKVESFRDSNMIMYMQLIEYSTNRQNMTVPRKIWCMNENGIKYLLRHMTVSKTGSKKRAKAREKGFKEACMFFNINKTKADLDPIFVHGLGKKQIEKYDIWSYICLTNDLYIDSFTKWKKCEECGFYYPYNHKYFGKNPNIHSKCLQCNNKDFKCSNKLIQYIYENNGVDLLYAIYKNDSEKALEEIKKIIKWEA